MFCRIYFNIFVGFQILIIFQILISISNFQNFKIYLTLLFLNTLSNKFSKFWHEIRIWNIIRIWNKNRIWNIILKVIRWFDPNKGKHRINQSKTRWRWNNYSWSTQLNRVDVSFSTTELMSKERWSYGRIYDIFSF